MDGLIAARIVGSRLEGVKRLDLVEERSLNYVTAQQQPSLVEMARTSCCNFLFLHFLIFVRADRLVLATLEMSTAMLSLLCYPHP